MAVFAALMQAFFVYLGNETGRTCCLWIMVLFLVIAFVLDILSYIAEKKN